MTPHRPAAPCSDRSASLPAACRGLLRTAPLLLLLALPPRAAAQVPAVLTPDPAVRLSDPAPLRPGDPIPGPPPPPDGKAQAARELVLNRRLRQLLVLEQGRTLKSFPVAVGMPGWETPVGTFKVLEKISNPVWEHPVSGARIPPGPNNPLGSRWIGFHRDCAGRSGFNGQEHLVVKGCVVAGFHGTPNRSSVGRAVSHGCVRLYDEHVQELYELVRLGTTVTVLP